MKKLMIAAAVVCAAALSQAASFTWQTSATAYGPLKDTITAGLVNGTVYPAATGTLKNRMDKEAAADSLGIKWAYELTLFDAANPTTKDVLSGDIAITEYSSGAIFVQGLASDLVYKPTDAAAVNKVNYELVMTGTYTDGNGTKWTLTSNTITGFNEYGALAEEPLLFKTGVAENWKATTSAVPEPTSAMLLLLGVAGLALKRRRA